MTDRPSDIRAELQQVRPLSSWLRSRLITSLWYTLSRAGDHGRLPPVRRLTQITPMLFCGGQIDRRGWQRMQSWGVGALVNLRVEWDDRYFGIQTPHSLWLPTIDGTAPGVEQLARGVQFIHENIEAGRGVYVHCAAGLGRAPTQAIAYLMWRGLPLNEAVEHVQTRRPIVHLSRWQQLRLQEYAAYLAYQDERQIRLETS